MKGATCMGVFGEFEIWGRFNVKLPSPQHRKSHYGGKTILRPSYLQSGISVEYGIFLLMPIFVIIALSPSSFYIGPYNSNTYQYFWYIRAWFPGCIHLINKIGKVKSFVIGIIRKVSHYTCMQHATLQLLLASGIVIFVNACVCPSM